MVTQVQSSEGRERLTRERVLRAAIDLVDEGGIDSLSMRKLGQALGVEAMSLYNHVANKDDILDGIADLIWSEIELPSGEEDWKADISKCATSAHDALVQHPWAANLIMGTNKVRPARIRYMETLLGRLREAGFSAEDTYHAYHAIDSHILGFTLWQTGHVMPSDMPTLENRADVRVFFAKALPQLNLEDYPHLIEHAELHLVEGSHKEEGEFEYGLGLILDSLQRIRDSEHTLRLVAVHGR